MTPCAIRAADEDHSPISLLVDELKHEEVEVRLNAIRNIGVIATALGEKRTREELIPFLTGAAALSTFAVVCLNWV